MNRYVVGFLSLFDNELDLEIVEANDEIGAAIVYASNRTDWEIDKSITTLEDLKDFFFNGDCAINVLRID